MKTKTDLKTIFAVAPKTTVNLIHSLAKAKPTKKSNAALFGEKVIEITWAVEGWNVGEEHKPLLERIVFCSVSCSRCWTGVEPGEEESMRDFIKDSISAEKI